MHPPLQAVKESQKEFPNLEFYLSETIMVWEVTILEELLVDFFRLRDSCDKKFPGCFTTIKPKEIYCSEESRILDEYYRITIRCIKLNVLL
jgi:hypothetical protein